MTDISLGTRSSQLARAQAELVAQALRKDGYDPKLVLMETRGDKVLDRAVHQIGGKGLFTEELEQALLSETIDVAVHSLKDLPTQLPKGLTIGAFALPDDRRDVLLSWGTPLLKLPSGAVLGTSSLRRLAFIKAMRPDLVVKPIRGNLGTRIEKWRGGQVDALVLAAAGVLRLGWESLVGEYLDPDVMVPSPGQGILALEVASHRHDLVEVLNSLNDSHAQAAALAERAVLAELGGSCQVPLGAYAQWTGLERLRLVAQVASLDGRRMMRKETQFAPRDAVKAGAALGGALKGEGALDLLEVAGG